MCVVQIPTSCGWELIHSHLLSGSPISLFTPSSLYPCSRECAQLSTPCSASCSGSAFTSSTANASFGSAVVCPRKSLRQVYSLFVDAIRDRLIDDICVPHDNVQDAGLLRMPRATRLGHGFVSSPEYVHSLWGFGWDTRAQSQ